MAGSSRSSCLAFCVAASVLFLSRASAKDQKPVYYTFCFWDALSRWRPAPHNFSVSDIPAELCSAVIYSHVTIDDKSGWIKLTEQELQLDPEAKAYSKSWIYNPIWMLPPHRVYKNFPVLSWFFFHREGAFRQLNELKKRNPKLKILLAVGGPREPVEKYWQFLGKMHLWRDTASGTATAQDSIRTWDTGRLIHPFFRDIRTKFRRDYIPDWRIVFTLPAFDSATQRLFDIDRLSQVVNFFIVKTSDCLEFPRRAGLNVSRTMDMSDIDRTELVVKRGAERLSVVLEIPLSGRTYSATGSSSGVHTVFTGRAGPYTKQQGFLSSYEICDHLRSGWAQERFVEEDCPFLRHDQEYVAYEDEESIRRKARMVMGRKYRGVAIRTVDLDDYSNSCTGKSHLVKTIRSSFNAMPPRVDFPYHTPNETWWEEDMFSTKNPFRPAIRATPSKGLASTPSKPDITTSNPQTTAQKFGPKWSNHSDLRKATKPDRSSTQAIKPSLEITTAVPSMAVPASADAPNAHSPLLHVTPPVVDKLFSASNDAFGLTSPEPYTTSSVPVAEEPEQKNICKRGGPNDLLPHETDCSKYYQCVHSTPYLKTCVQNTIFDIERQICNWPTLTNRPECII